MNKSGAVILEKVNRIEKDLQALKVELYFRLPSESRKSKIYSERNLLAEIKKTRKKFWDAKYSKSVS